MHCINIVAYLFALDDGEPAEAVEIPAHPTAQVKRIKSRDRRLAYRK
jgi:hypothetical protein